MRSATAQTRFAIRRAQYSSIVLALLLGAIVATAGWRWLHLRRRAQGRRAWLEHALSSADALQRLSALRLVSVWPTPDVAAVADLLMMAADHLSHPESGVAGAILKERFPADALIERMRRGGGGGRARAAQLLALHPAETVVEALLDAAISARGIVRKAVIESLARLLCQQPVRKLLQALSSSDESLRSAAVEVVEQAGPRSGPVLRRALADPDETTRCVAIEALTLARSPGSAQAIAGLLSDPSDHVRVKAAWGLGVLGADEGVANALLAALNDPSAEVQDQVGLALIELGDEYLGELALALDRRASEDLSFRASEELLAAMAAKTTQPVPAYERALSSLNRGFAHDVARALERNGNLDSWVAQLAELEGEQRGSAIAVLGAAALAGAIAPILRGVELPDVKVRESCARLLGEVALPAVIGPLRELLSDPEEGLRTTAVEALARIDAPDASESLISALGDPSPRVRAKAAEGLRSALRLRQSASASTAAAEVSRRSVEALLRAVHDVSAAVREKVVQALGTANTEKAVDLLVNMALHDTDAAVRAAAIAALGEMEAYDVLPFLLLDVVNSDDRDLRARVMEILSHAVDPIVFEPMMGALQDTDETVRAVAGRGLWDVVSSEQCQSLLPYLNSPDAKVRAAVVGVLGKTRSAEWAGTLAAAGADPDPHVRAAIVNALGRIGEGAAPYVDAIISRMTDTDAYVRSRAAEAAFLVAPHHPEMAGQVLKLATDPDASVRSAAVASLVNFARNGIQDALVQLLTDADHWELAIPALANVEDDLLRRILAHAQKARPEMAPSVTEALSQVLAGRRTVGDLWPVLSSLDTEVRMAGLEDLSLVRQDDATHEIIRLLAGDPVSRVRLRAAQILSARCGNNLPARQALRRAAATDPDEGVRRVAQDAIQATPEQGTQAQP
jgi:HEAT repeat protein